MGVTGQGKPKTAEDLLDLLRENIGKSVDNSLNYANKWVQQPRPTTKDLSEATFDYMNTNASLTLDVLRNAKDLL